MVGARLNDNDRYVFDIPVFLLMEIQQCVTLMLNDTATTDIYTREVLTDPVDNWSESVYQGMLMLG